MHKNFINNFSFTTFNKAQWKNVDVPKRKGSYCIYYRI